MVGVEQLSEIEAFQMLSQPTRQHIADRAASIDRLSGEELYQQGDPPSGFFALRSGRVKLYRQSKDKCQILALPMPGDCFGAESLPTGAPNPYSASTLTETSGLVIAAEDLPSLLIELPDFQEAFLKLVTDRLKEFVTLVHDLAFRDVTSRLAMVLVSRARREGLITQQGITIDRLLSQEEFAAMVGTAREVISRTFKKFRSEGLLEIERDRIVILDLDALAKIAAQEAR